jgi:hypothetical protein
MEKNAATNKKQPQPPAIKNTVDTIDAASTNQKQGEQSISMEIQTCVEKIREGK